MHQAFVNDPINTDSLSASCCSSFSQVLNLYGHKTYDYRATPHHQKNQNAVRGVKPVLN